MEILLLGTGASDGIPNPFCGCATCHDYRRRGELRTNTSVLIDDRLLIDPGPEAPRQVSRFGRDLRRLQAVLAGHAHHDHLDPSFLMYRGWVTEAPLRMVGPEPVTSSCRHWLPEDTAVELDTVTAGDQIQVAGYQVEVVATNHHAFGEAVGYRIERDGSSLLYLTDTGLLPEPTLARLAGRRVDLVLLEETFGSHSGKGEQHLHLGTFAETVTALRDRGVIDDLTRVVAIHLGHDNPPLAELREALAGCGAEVLPDGASILL